MASASQSPDYRDFVALLRELRETVGLRQVDVAELLGVPQSYVSKYESGERRLDVIETARVAAVLGSSLEEIAKRLS